MRLGNKVLAVIFGMLLLNLGREYLFVKAAVWNEGTPSSAINYDIEKKDWNYYSSVFKTIKPIQVSLPLTLKGTIISDPSKSFAIIEDANSKKQDLYRLGDMVYDAKIVSMNRNSVTLD